MTTPTSTFTYDAALQEALVEEMRRDDRVFLIGTYPNAPLTEEFGAARVRVTPISESAITGMAIGAAGSGFRPIVNWGNICFSFVAFDQVANQAARIRYMFGGQRDFPIVFRARYLNGTRSAAQHSQTGYALHAHLGGLKIAAPSNAADAKGLLKAAIRDPNPVVFFESHRLAASESEIPDGDAVVPFGSAAVRRSGTDVTIVAIAYMVELALQSAAALEAQGVSAEVIDPRTLVPLDIDAIRASVRRTGRLVVVDESFPTCSFASEIITAVVEDPDCLDALQAPPQRVCTRPVPVPFSPVLEDYVLPGTGRIEDAVRVTLEHRRPSGG
jgi:pyruvate dehydrogenase E1 component beta subunit